MRMVVSAVYGEPVSAPDFPAWRETSRENRHILQFPPGMNEFKPGDSVIYVKNSRESEQGKVCVLQGIFSRNLRLPQTRLLQIPESVDSFRWDNHIECNFSLGSPIAPGRAKPQSNPRAVALGIESRP
jgi:hypothetical protein